MTAAAAALQAYVPRLGGRLLPAPAVAVLCLTGLGWLAIHAFTAYLRADRDEPLLGATALGVVLTVAVTALMATRSAVAATLGYSLAVMAGALPLVAIAFGAERSRRIRRQAARPSPTDA